MTRLQAFARALVHDAEADSSAAQHDHEDTYGAPEWWMLQYWEDWAMFKRGLLPNGPRLHDHHRLWADAMISVDAAVSDAENAIRERAERKQAKGSAGAAQGGKQRTATTQQGLQGVRKPRRRK